MAETILEYTYAGDPTFAVNYSLGYIDRSHVQVRVNLAVDGAGDPVYANFVWVDASNITITDPLVNGDEIAIIRTVPKDSLAVEFSEGDDITPENLDKQALQGLMTYEELLDGRVGESSPKLDADRAELARDEAEAANIAAQAAKTDAEAAAATIGTSVSDAAASAAAAAASETAAGTSETNAANSASAASASQTAAATSASNASTSASNAATSETNAANSASAAATSESNAASSESAAATSAAEAADSASIVSPDKFTEISTPRTLVASDRRSFIKYNPSGTVNLASAGELGNGWWCDIFAQSFITLDPAGSQLINGKTTQYVYQGSTVRVHSDGTELYTTLISSAPTERFEISVPTASIAVDVPFGARTARIKYFNFSPEVTAGYLQARFGSSGKGGPFVSTSTYFFKESVGGTSGNLTGMPMSHACGTPFQIGEQGDGRVEISQLARIGRAPLSSVMRFHGSANTADLLTCYMTGNTPDLVNAIEFTASNGNMHTLSMELEWVY